jgi:glutathione peroxidase-family protein
MKKSFALFILLASIFLLNGFTNPDARELRDFHLRNVDGKFVSMNDYRDAKGFIIVFTCNHCPFAKLYPERLNNLNKKYLKLQVPLIAISSTDTLIYEEDSYSKMIEVSKEKDFSFPYLKDNTQDDAKNFQAQKTPHPFVLWKENNQWKIKYNGAIDDNGEEPDKVNHSYIEEAVDALLKGQTVAVAETKSIGCTIKWRNQ